MPMAGQHRQTLLYSLTFIASSLQQSTKSKGHALTTSFSVLLHTMHNLREDTNKYRYESLLTPN